MNRTLCGLLGLGLAAGLAGGQNPTPPPPKPIPQDKEVVERQVAVALALAGGPVKNPLDEAIATAMKSNPDVRVAEAEVQVAQAKLAQAKLLVAQKAAAAHAALERAKTEVTAAEQAYARTADLVKKGMVSKEEAEAIRQKLDAAKANLARAQTDYDAALGTVPGQALKAAAFSPDGKLAATATGELFALDTFPHKVVIDFTPAVAPGSFPDRLRGALGKTVKLPEQKVVDVGAALTTVMKAAGVEGRVRVPQRLDPKVVKDGLPIALPAGEYPLGTWFQLIADECATHSADLRALEDGKSGPIPPVAGRYEFFVRDYGLLVADAKNPPAGAVTVADLAKLKAAEKPAKP